MLVGGPNAAKSRHAWRQVYRALEHGFAKNACKNRTIVSKFPKPIEDFANTFLAMQIKRHSADYDPATRYVRSIVMQDIDTAKTVVEAYLGADRKDRLAFAIHILFKTRGSEQV